MLFVPRSDRLPRPFALITVVCASVLLASCGTLSKEECLSADWSAIGESDGAAGFSAQSRLAGHVKACAKAGVAPDQVAWRAGHKQGLVRYCTPQNGLFVGEAGRSYSNVCPIRTESAFLSAFNVGKSAYQARSALDRVKRNIATKQDLVSSKLKNFADLTAEQQIVEQYEIADLNRQILDHQGDVLRLSGEVARSEQAVADYREQLRNAE